MLIQILHAIITKHGDITGDYGLKTYLKSFDLLACIPTVVQSSRTPNSLIINTSRQQKSYIVKEAEAK